MLPAILLLAARFSVQPLAVEGDVLSVTPADLDGDGHKDLLAAYSTGLPPWQRRFFAVFWNRGGTFAPKPDLVLPVSDEETCAYDVAPSGDGPDELLLLTPHGVLAQSFRGRTAAPQRKLLEQPTLYQQPVPGELPRVNLAQELGGRVLLVPALGSLAIWRPSAAGWEKAADLEIDMDVSGPDNRRRTPRHASLGPISVRYAFPAVHLADTNGDGLADIIAAQEDRVAIYPQRPGFVFQRQPEFTRDFAIRTAEDHRDRSGNVSLLVADLDGDGIADLILRKQIFQGVTSAKSTSYVFFGRKGGGYAKQAAQVLESEGVGPLAPQLIDLDGDGRPDLVVPETSFGVFALIRILTARTAKVNFRVFPFVPAKRAFAPQPAAERSLKFSFSFSGDSDLQAVNLTADYTGDGKPDLAFATGDEELSIFPGSGGGAFADDAAEAIPVRAAGELLPVDLDGKKRSDIVIFHPQTRGHRGEIEVLINRGPWQAPR